jgi:hypothetical protein
MPLACKANTESASIAVVVESSATAKGRWRMNGIIMLTFASRDVTGWSAAFFVPNGGFTPKNPGTVKLFSEQSITIIYSFL